MRYSEGRHYTNTRYRNTTQAMTPRVVVTPSIDTARRALAACRINLALGVNAHIYMQKIAQIYAAYPELKEEVLCTQQQ